MHDNCIRIQMGFVTFWSVFTHLNNTERRVSLNKQPKVQ